MNIDGIPLALIEDGDITGFSPVTDYDIGKLWRRIKREESELEKVIEYKKQVLAAIKEQEDRHAKVIEEARGLALRYVLDRGGEKVKLPDLGTVFVTKRQAFTIDQEQAKAWARENKADLFSIVTTENFDTAALKKYATSSGEVIPGVEIGESQSITFKGK